MKKLLLIVTLFFTVTLHAQEIVRYQTKDGPIEFTTSPSKYYIEYAVKDNIAIYALKANKPAKVNDSSAVISMSAPQSNLVSRKTEINNLYKSAIKKIEPVLVYKDGTEEVCNGKLIIKMKNSNAVESMLKNYKFTVSPNEFVKNQYSIKIQNITTQQLFALVNQLQGNANVEFAEPDFIRFTKLNTTDPFFSSQWAVTQMSVGGAWGFATGSGIKVAVIDVGVELTHPDLSSNLLSGYDATGGGSAGGPDITNNDYHGTACAGIIGAVANNSIGTAGVAYNAKIIPVRMGYSSGASLITTDTWVGNSISWAKTAGADVMSNSYKIGSPSSTITNAINDAITNGRSGKGCVVLFAAGNDSGTVSYPAYLSGVIAVGASSTCDELKSTSSCDGEWWWGSNYGTNLDVVAPGVQIYTADLTGTAGASSTDYDSAFNGTSAACPNTAGVIALILSVNPSLTQQQARNILESTCDKIGGYTYNSGVSGQPNGTWATETGYGRINACLAVTKASVSVSGSSSLCSGTDNTYTVANLPSGATVTWAIDGGGALEVSTSGNDITVTEDGYGIFTMRATVTTACGTFEVSSDPITAGQIYLLSFADASSNGLGGDPGVLCNHAYDFDDYVNTFTYTLNEVPAYALTLHYIIIDPIYGTIYTNAVSITAQTGTYTLPPSLPVGYYSLEIWVTGGVCSEASEWYEVPLEYANCHTSGRMAVYPNPANSELTIAAQPTDQKAKAAIAPGIAGTRDFSIKIYNSKGQVLKEDKNSNKKEKIVVPVADLANGTYYLHIQDGSNLTRQQIIIKH